MRQLVALVPDAEPSPVAINRVIAHAREEQERSRSIWGFRWVKVLAPLCLAVVIGGLVAYQFRAGLAPRPIVYAPKKEEQRPAVQEPLSAPEPEKKSSLPAAPPQTKAAAREEAMTSSAAGNKPEASAPSLLNSGDRALEARRYAEAGEAFSQALRLLLPGHPDRPHALLGLARAQEGQKDRSGALQTYGELAKESPTHRDLAEAKMHELSGPEVK